jgi:hypothetical protein
MKFVKTYPSRMVRKRGNYVMSQWSFKMLGELEFMIDDKGVLNHISCQIFAYVKRKEKLQSQITCWNILDIKNV